MNLFHHAFLRVSRDPRRSFFQAAGVGTVCLLLILWGTLSSGFASTIYQMATRLLLGQIQIHHPRFGVTESIYDNFPFSPSQGDELHARKFNYSYRLYQYALVSLDDATKGARIVGIDPKQEAETTDLPQHMSEGTFAFPRDSNEAVIGYHLAEMLKVHIGSEIVVLGTGADGGIASEVYRVTGILKPISQIVDDRYVYIGDLSFRRLFNLSEGIHELILTGVGQGRHYQEPQKGDLDRLFPNADIKTWRETKPQLSQVLDMLKFAGIVTLTLVFIALGMLILNLKLMTVFDRSREYGMMLAIGLHPQQLVRLVLAESFWISILAAVFAVTLALPLGYLAETKGLDFSFLIDHYSYSTLVMEPLLYGEFGVRQVIEPLIFMFLMFPLATLYPAYVASRFQPREAIHGRGAGL